MQKGVKVPRKIGEATRKHLQEIGALKKDLKIKMEGEFLIIPIRDGSFKEMEKYSIVETDFSQLARPKSFEEYLKGFLSDDEIDMVRTSFDTIGEIAIIEVPRELESFKGQIARALMKAHSAIKTVLQKTGNIQGELRLRKLHHLAGKKTTETIYRESGMRLKLDVASVYFSPRLSHERERIAEQVKDGEIIVDLFAGIGPFSILMAKKRKVKIYAIDLNKSAIDYLKANIELNKLKGEIIPIYGDAREKSPRGIASRVLMNLPKASDQFLDLAFDTIDRGTIHFYTISPEIDLFESKEMFIRQVASEKGKKIQIINKKKVRPYSPRNYHVVFDIFVE